MRPLPPSFSCIFLGGIKGERMMEQKVRKKAGRPPGSPNKTKRTNKYGSKGRKTGELKKCITCVVDKDKKDFYASHSPTFGDNLTPICRECCKKVDVSDLEAVKDNLRKVDRAFLPEVWDKSLEESARIGDNAFGIYMRTTSFKQYWDLTWKESVFDSKIDNEELILDAELAKTEQIQFTHEDEMIKKDCLKLLGYDPFDGYAIGDQRILYAEMLPYLDEDTLEDQHKISVIIQLLNNNIQIRKIDLSLNNLTSDQKTLLNNAVTLKNLTATKKQIADNNDKLAKENSIAIKHRGDKKAGRSTLGYLMKDLRELGFDKAEENYYDMKKSYGMRITAEISSKAISSQLNFDEKDIEDMLKEQRDLIIELQNKNEELEEKLRLAKLDLKNAVSK